MCTNYLRVEKGLALITLRFGYVDIADSFSLFHTYRILHMRQQIRVGLVTKSDCGIPKKKKNIF